MFFPFTKNKDSKYFWFDSLSGLVVILAVLAMPLFVVSYFLNLNLILAPIIMGAFVAAVRKGLSELIGKKMSSERLIK